MCRHFLWDIVWGHNVEYKAALVSEQAKKGKTDQDNLFQ